MGRIWKDLEAVIQNRYQLKENEWVQVIVSKRGKIHVTVVTDSDIKRADLKKLLEKEVEKRDENYQIGFVNIYSVEQAEELHIEKIRKRDDYLSWSDALYADDIPKENKTETQVISFYSYKGGVGRTIALIETAYNLAAAGKRVMLLDLDVEAPSLHNIFYDKVNDEISGVKYGTIEYLYRKVIQGSEDVRINDIFCSLQLKNVSGEIFVMPALKTMNKDYLYQIERLQTQQIQEEDVFSKIFAYVQKELNVDIILLDTRAGFNQWGSLSLLTLSNQVIFIAYPNNENIEGLNMALQLMQNIGKKRYAVAMSKVVATEEGVVKARSLFQKLNVAQKDLIPIYYKQEIALSNRYPIESEDILGAYKELSDYILNNEKIERNKKLLMNGMKKQLLDHMFIEGEHLIRLLAVEQFLNQDANMFLKYRYKEELYGISNSQIRKSIKKRGNAYVLTTIYSVASDEKGRECTEILKSENNDIESIGVKLILLLTRNLNGQATWWAKNQSEITTASQVIDMLTHTVRGRSVLAFSKKGEPVSRVEKDKQEYKTTDELRLMINIKEEMLKENADQVIENIRGLISFFNKDREEIQFNFIVHEQVWEKYPELFSVFKGNTIETNVTIRDIKKFIIVNIDEKTFLPFTQNINTLHQVIENGSEYNIEQLLDDMEDEDYEEIIDLILGIRKDVKMYSESVVKYLYRFLQEHKEEKYSNLLKILKRVAKREIENPDEHYPDRLISFSRLQQELERA
jgi:MinD-like ATPase involved in chromosome partitioning or flagellar assembly